MRGASTPFQFKQVSVDDLIEIEDENGEMLVIKTKTAMLEEQLKKAYDLQASLRRVCLNFILNITLIFVVLYQTNESIFDMTD